MSTNRIIGIVLIIIGGGLLFFGLQATGSFTEEMHETFTGRFTDETTWYLLGGGAALVVGLIMALRGGK
ncbi:DUF3185 family protein [Wenzhouxiangella sp. XN201]|uniref:DUF3185 family protein n=1 Tax=Wenzhouxiangella sp. XN201 TaxID=2710755 RepID=UPI0013C85227|nr:DUF3185 family protein [Wenzhouxiangella sp. XN201]NEZ04352.1 DUF3185 family protein [Wenzhouxiangella sp. XN201]